MILVIDNYDSFTFNLVQYLGEVTDSRRQVRVIRNDDCTIHGVRALLQEATRMGERNHIVISPGPCTPNEAGISMEVAKTFSGQVPVLGVCLGHQAIAQAFGAKIVRAEVPMHGKSTLVEHKGSSIFANLPNQFTAGRYHSLVVHPASIPPTLEPLAWSPEGELMALRLREFPTTIGVQFHPESILTPIGHDLLRAFTEL